MERRAFFKGIAAATAAIPLMPEIAAGLAERLGSLSRDLAAASNTRALWQRVRREFRLHPGLVHLNCGSIGATPRVVTDALTAYLAELEGNPLANTWGGLGNEMEKVRAKGAEFIGAELDETVLTRNTTEGMNHVASGLDLRPGDEVLTTNHEHGGGMVCWQHLAHTRGVAVRYIKMPNPVRDAAQILQRVEDHLTPRTRVCSFSHIDTITGLQMPLAAIAALTRPRDILLVCDGAQAPGMIDVDVKALGVDTYASSSHKWMLAPKGTGLLYIRKEVQDRVRPAFTYSGYGAYSASSGTRNVPQIVAHGVAMEFHNAIGRPRIEARCRQLCGYARQRLAEIPQLAPITPLQRALSSGIVSFALTSGRHSAVVAALQKRAIFLKPAQGTYAYVEDADVPKESYNALRISTHIFNDETDIDRAVEALRDVLG